MPRKPTKRKKSARELATKLGQTTHRQQAFLLAFRQCGTIRRAAEAAKIARKDHYLWIEASDDYAQQFEDAKKDAADLLEDEARRRAKDGLIRFKFYKGAPIIDPRTNEPYFEIEYSDSLLQFLLKGAMPDKYRERLDVNAPSEEPPAGMAELEAARALVALGKEWGMIETRPAGT